MDRPPAPPPNRPSRLSVAFAAFFLAENRLRPWQRLSAIVILAILFALLGDCLDVSARLLAVVGR